tara:strand:- start:4 stop:453 length:450 start_codon:yes stop_codon:yes gene_type:complete
VLSLYKKWWWLMKVEGLRSPQVKVVGLYHFGCMIDKIRLYCIGNLPDEYFRGSAVGLDGYLYSLLEIRYDELQERVKSGSNDKETLEWCCDNGHKPNKIQVRVQNGFVSKMGWKDPFSTFVNHVKSQAGIEDINEIVTLFELIALDEDS